MSTNENSPPVEAAAASTPRSRLPRWTRHETLVLIQARRAMERQQAVRLRPKWAAVSAYCRRHGVERGPMQCRKRWGNLSWDLKKIVAWEGKAADAGAQHESFWDMRGEERRARQLPSSFDREVYDAIVAGEDDAAAAVPDFGEEMYEQPPIMVIPISGQREMPPCSSCRVTYRTVPPPCICVTRSMFDLRGIMQQGGTSHRLPLQSSNAPIQVHTHT
jgi:hypothetical protein